MILYTMSDHQIQPHESTTRRISVFDLISRAKTISQPVQTELKKQLHRNDIPRLTAVNASNITSQPSSVQQPSALNRRISIESLFAEAAAVQSQSAKADVESDHSDIGEHDMGCAAATNLDRDKDGSASTESVPCPLDDVDSDDDASVEDEIRAFESVRICTPCEIPDDRLASRKKQKPNIALEGSQRPYEACCRSHSLKKEAAKSYDASSLKSFAYGKIRTCN